MYALLLGITLILLKYLEVGPVANWSWWWVLSPLPWLRPGGPGPMPRAMRKAMERWISANKTVSTSKGSPGHEKPPTTLKRWHGATRPQPQGAAVFVLRLLGYV